MRIDRAQTLASHRDHRKVPDDAGTTSLRLHPTGHRAGNNDVIRAGTGRQPTVTPKTCSSV
jgi:hypothetical protein